MTRRAIWTAILVALAAIGAAVWLAGSKEEAAPPSSPTVSATPSPRTVRPRSGAPTSRGAESRVIAGRVTGLHSGDSTRVEARRVGDCPKPEADRASWFEERPATPPDMAPADAQTPAAPDGAFALTVTSPGTYLVTAKASDGREASREVEVPAEMARAEVEIPLSGGALSLRGRVVQTDGAPFRGWIDLGPHEWSRSDERVRCRTVPDAEGRFEFRGLGAQTWDVAASVPGESSTTALCVTTPRSEELTLTIGAGALFRGRVVAASDGSPIAGASVFADLALGEAAEQRWTTTDVDGWFAVRAEAVRVAYASAQGFAAGWWQRDERAPAADIVVRLSRTGALQGRVLSASDGSPVAGAVVRASNRRSNLVLGPATSAADGSYRIDGAAPGRWDVFVLGGGWASAALATWSEGNYDENQLDPFAVDIASGVTETCDLRVEPTARIVGKVLGPTGDPVRAARVTLGRAGERKKGPEWRVPSVTWTSGDGSFAFADLPPCERFVLEATSPGLPKAQGSAKPEPGTTTTIDLRFETPQHLEVTVVAAADSAPVPNAEVGISVIDSDGSVSSREYAVTGADGRCVVADAHDGALAVTASARGFVAIDSDHAVLATRDAVDPRSWRAEVRLQPAFVVSGRVLHADDSPAVGLHVNITTLVDGFQTPLGNHEETDEEGRFRFVDVPAGTYSICEGSEDEPLAAVVAGGPEVTIRLSDAKTARPFQLTFVGSDGTPIPAAHVQVDSETMREGTWFADGKLTVDAASHSGTIVLTVYRPEVDRRKPLPFGTAIVTLPDPLPASFEIRLPPERVAKGRVVGPGGRGVEGAVVTAKFAKGDLGDDVASAVSTSDGSFEVHRLGEGLFRLEVEPPRDFVPPAPIEIRGGEEGIVIEVASALGGVVTVIGWDGSPVRGAVVEARALRMSGEEAKEAERRWRASHRWDDVFDPRRLAREVTKGDGVARVAGIVPGTECSLSVSGPTNRDDLAPWSSTPWTPGDVEVRLERAYPVRGVVVDASGAPNGYSDVLVAKDGGWDKIGADPDGRFTIPGLRRGETRRVRAVTYSTSPGDDSSAVWTTVTAGDADVRLTVAAAK